MKTHTLVAVLAMALSSVALSAQTPAPAPAKKVGEAPIKPTSAADPKAMYTTYCAVCHGADGKGGGPAAASLKKAPTDLTMLSAQNGGSFPETRVKRYISGADDIAAHGNRAMPMWGDLFKSLNPDTAELRVQALSNYVKSMQAKK